MIMNAADLLSEKDAIKLYNLQVYESLRMFHNMTHQGVFAGAFLWIWELFN